MTLPRDQFLQRVRKSVAQGNRAGGSPALPERGGVGYQGAGPDAVQKFCTELTVAGGLAHVVADGQSAVAKVMELVEAKQARKILLGRGPYLDPLDLAAPLRAVGKEVMLVDDYSSRDRDGFFSADLGISGVDYLIAETGTVVVASKPDDPRSVSLLPPVHIAVATRRQLLADLFDLFDGIQAKGFSSLPSCISLITGPSKTGDIELKLVTGVHGPGEVHVVLLG